jgi:hypothetical protein
MTTMEHHKLNNHSIMAILAFSSCCPELNYTVATTAQNVHIETGKTIILLV